MSNRFHMPSTAPVDLTGRTILQVVPQLETGGAEVTTFEMAEAIVKAGGRAVVASQGGTLEAKSRRRGARSFICPWPQKIR